MCTLDIVDVVKVYFSRFTETLIPIFGHVMLTNPKLSCSEG